MASRRDPLHRLQDGKHMLAGLAVVSAAVLAVLALLGLLVRNL